MSFTAASVVTLPACACTLILPVCEGHSGKAGSFASVSFTFSSDNRLSVKKNGDVIHGSHLLSLHLRVPVPWLSLGVILGQAGSFAGVAFNFSGMTHFVKGWW